jgi:hypothetical protein
MEKLLAALSIPQVGAIRRLDSKPDERKPLNCDEALRCVVAQCLRLLVGNDECSWT